MLRTLASLPCIPATWDGMRCQCYLGMLKRPTQLLYHPNSPRSRHRRGTRTRIWHATPPPSHWIPIRRHTILKGLADMSWLTVVHTAPALPLRAPSRRISVKILRVKSGVSEKGSKIWKPLSRLPLAPPRLPICLKHFVHLGSGELKRGRRCSVLSTVQAMRSVLGMTRDASAENTLPEMHPRVCSTVVARTRKHCLKKASPVTAWVVIYQEQVSGWTLNFGPRCCDCCRSGMDTKTVILIMTLRLCNGMLNKTLNPGSVKRIRVLVHEQGGMITRTDTESLDLLTYLYSSFLNLHLSLTLSRYNLDLHILLPIHP